MVLTDEERVRRLTPEYIESVRLKKKAYDNTPEQIIKRKEYAKKYELNHDVKEWHKNYYLTHQKNNPIYKQRRKDYSSRPENKIKANISKRKSRLNPERRIREGEKNKQRKLDRKMRVYNHYSNYDIKCNCCGEKQIEFLSIDHVNNDGAEHRRTAKNSHGHLTGNHIIYWLIQNNYPPGFQILCMNCNHAKGKDPEHLCPHQKENAEKSFLITKSNEIRH